MFLQNFDQVGNQKHVSFNDLSILSDETKTKYFTSDCKETWTAEYPIIPTVKHGGGSIVVWEASRVLASRAATNDFFSNRLI